MAISKWKRIPFQDTSFLSNRRASPPWAVTSTDVFEHDAILEALNTASGNSAFVRCTQDTAELAVFRGVLVRSKKNPAHLTPSERITILMAADYLYVLWHANIPQSYHSVTQSQLKAAVSMFPDLTESAMQRFLHYKKVVSNKSFVQTPARFPTEVGDAIDLAYQTYTALAPPDWFYTLLLLLAQSGTPLLLKTSALTGTTAMETQSSHPQGYTSTRLRSGTAAEQATAARAPQSEHIQTASRPPTPLKTPKRAEKSLPEPDANAIRDLARQQEVQFDAINSRIASMASESTRHNDLMTHPVLASLLSEVQTVKSQLHAFLASYSSQHSDASHMTPQTVTLDEDDTARDSSAPQDTHRKMCTSQGCYQSSVGTSDFCALHTDSVSLVTRPRATPHVARQTVCSAIGCQHFAILAVGNLLFCAPHAQTALQKEHLPDAHTSLTSRAPSQSVCLSLGCHHFARTDSDFCALHTQVPPHATPAQSRPDRSMTPTAPDTSPLGSEHSDSVQVVASKAPNPTPTPILIPEDEAQTPVFTDFTPAMTPARYMASLPPSRPTPRRPDTVAEARAHLLNTCAALKVYCLSNTPSNSPDRRPEGVYPATVTQGPAWTLARDQANWMPDYGKWKALSPSYNARHYKEPESPYTDDCLIQLNDFELPEGLTPPQRRKFHRMALARCVAVVYGLDFMTVSCAIARHVIDTYELQELQQPITPIKFLLEPVAEVLAFFRAVSQAEPLPP